MREELLYISAHKDHAHRTQERTGYVIFYFHDEEAFLASIFFSDYFISLCSSVWSLSFEKNCDVEADVSQKLIVRVFFISLQNRLL